MHTQPQSESDSQELVDSAFVFSPIESNHNNIISDNDLHAHHLIVCLSGGPYQDLLASERLVRGHDYAPITGTSNQ